ncbi:hypothetical protein FYJ43_11920 [Cutibacterium sp. WCA-380-WT-3A]|uniref:Uncharacterized protein n=1 Tax=Cutibacterium porci TaxID=2605781 RepID=A0A7K0J9P7_9ACTN|nr:hypothetical protein [Cutibacterium porci]MSS46704.1 hypothetical protein [Cutibacterium porci]
MRKSPGIGRRFRRALAWLLVGILVGGGTVIWLSRQNVPALGGFIGTSEKTTDRRVVKSMEFKGDVYSV